ncbi:MAG: hypothetical protein QOF51_974 [Chloroflexota bacterium]|jgi:hypothetical protein|nr:hypothetical protein [Chloroflexota bacterium]
MEASRSDDVERALRALIPQTSDSEVAAAVLIWRAAERWRIVIDRFTVETEEDPAPFPDANRLLGVDPPAHGDGR